MTGKILKKLLVYRNIQELSEENKMNKINKIIPILRCIKCGNKNIIIRKRPEDYDFNLKINLDSSCLMCKACKDMYPITDDYIPIMWTEAIRDYFISGDENMSTAAANISTYDNISNYYALYSRQSLLLKERMIYASKNILGLEEAKGKKHLDFGCGPGNVIKWLSNEGYNHFGLDVSLTNLRNTHKETGALVILGDAVRLPFKEGIFDLVTESAVLHHIDDWRAALNEACRVCRNDGGLIIDSEPSKIGLDWSKVAQRVFNSRWYAYHLLSYINKSKFRFRDISKAKLEYWEAEIHNQPGKGFPVDELEDLIKSHNFKVETVFSSDSQLNPSASPNIKSIVLNLLSFKNPWDPRYGLITVVAKNE